MTLEEMKCVDPRTVDRRTLVDRYSVHIDPNAPREDRCRQFVEQIGNPYCYLDGKTELRQYVPYHRGLHTQLFERNVILGWRWRKGFSRPWRLCIIFEKSG